MKPKFVLIGVAVLIAIIVIVSMSVFMRDQVVSPAVGNPPTPAPDIQLTDKNGQPYRLSTQYGKVNVLYFGYTNCKEECPLAMAHLKLALGLLGNNSSQIQVTMVSTDPERDTPRAMSDFVSQFNPAFQGLTGSADDLQKVWSAYQITVLKSGEIHSNFIYIIDRAGLLRAAVLADATPDSLAADLRPFVTGN